VFKLNTPVRLAVRGILLCALFLQPIAAGAVELDGFVLGAPKGKTLSRLAEAGSPGTVIRCNGNPLGSNEDCRVNRRGARFEFLGLPLEQVLVEFSSGTTDVIEFRFRSRTKRESVYASVLQAISARLSLPTHRDARGVTWEHAGSVAILRMVKGGGVSLLLMKRTNQSYEPASDVIASHWRSGALAAHADDRSVWARVRAWRLATSSMPAA
jgi:hypothetical protein